MEITTLGVWMNGGGMGAGAVPVFLVVAQLLIAVPPVHTGMEEDGECYECKAKDKDASNHSRTVRQVSLCIVIFFSWLVYLTVRWRQSWRSDSTWLCGSQF